MKKRNQFQKKNYSFEILLYQPPLLVPMLFDYLDYIFDYINNLFLHHLTFYLLDNGEDQYMNADVLWITDFLIPRTTEDLMKRFKDYQATGTKFYGFKIGQGESNWDKYFDKIYEVHYKQPRRF